MFRGDVFAAVWRTLARRIAWCSCVLHHLLCSVLSTSGRSSIARMLWRTGHAIAGVQQKHSDAPPLARFANGCSSVALSSRVVMGLGVGRLERPALDEGVAVEETGV